ncbi:hypothetical protein COO20_12560 [Thalassospira marina]|uniref:TPM domain-containing protein n=2 Tax=Thalassospira marina TaxID=2048283 RepID=A0A2N3KTD3_9PROT|nr:hypothetical protein COO20_12560 [Thalassospira marina]
MLLPQIFVSGGRKSIVMARRASAMRGCGNVPRYAAFMLLALAFLLPVFDRAQAAFYERKARYVNDAASLLTKQEADALAAKLQAFEDKELIEISVLTVEKFPQTEDGIYTLLEDTYRDWNMGNTETESSSYRRRLQAFITEQNLAKQAQKLSLEEMVQKYAGLAPHERTKGRAVLVIFSKEDRVVRVLNGNGFGLAKGEWRKLYIYHFNPILAHGDMSAAIDLIVDMVMRRSVNMAETAEDFSIDSPGFRKPLDRFPLKRFDRYVNDFAGLLSPAAVAGITSKLTAYEQENGTEISVLTVHSYKDVSSQESWEGFATEIFHRFDIGGKNTASSVNKGVLFVVSDGDRKVRIELGAGYTALYDTIMKQVIDSIVPALHDGNYETGISDGIAQIIAKTRADVSYVEWHKWPIFIGVVVFLSIAAAIRNRMQDYVAIHWLIVGSIGAAIIFICQTIFNILYSLQTRNRQSDPADLNAAYQRLHHHHHHQHGGGDGGGGGGGDSGGGASGSF